MSRRQRPAKHTENNVAPPANSKYSVFYDADPDAAESLPPITISCAACERIVGDSTAFAGANRELQTVTLEEVVSVETDSELVTCDKVGSWDEFCNYKKLLCGKCGHELGKKYYATTNELASLQKKYTLSIPALSFYRHGTSTPSLPVAASNEILSLIRPEPDQMAETMSQVMMLCVLLREEQEGVMRALQKISEQTGVDVGGEEVEREARKDDGLRGKIEELVKAVERLKEEFVVKSELEALKEEVGERSRGNSRGTSRGGARETTRETTRETRSEAETQEEGETEGEEEEEEEEQEEDRRSVVEELEVGDADEDYSEEVRELPRKRRRGNHHHVVVDLAKSPEVPDIQPHRGQSIGNRRTSGRTSRHLK